MSIRYVKLIVRRNVMEGIARTVPLWEAPILEAVHGTSALEVQGEIERDVPAPATGDEFARLGRLYGKHPDSGLSFVEYVYGRPTTGQLEKAIEQSVVKRSGKASASTPAASA